MIGEAASGRGAFGEFLSRNAGLLGGGAAAGGLAGVLLNSKHARKFAGTALQVGAAAVLGGLAYKAFKDYRAGRRVIPQGLQDAIQGMLAGAGPASSGDRAARLTDRTQEHTATLLLRAMIASAMADGRTDAVERQRLIDRVEASELSQDERAFLESLIERPDPPAALAASVASPEEAAQVYLAAFIAIDGRRRHRTRMAGRPCGKAGAQSATSLSVRRRERMRNRAVTCKLRACVRDRADSLMARRAAISSLRWRICGAETVEHEG